MGSKSAKAPIAAAQSFTQQQLDLNQIFVSESMVELNGRALEGALRDDVSPAEHLQLDATHLSVLRMWESHYTAVEEGIVDPVVLDGMSRGPNPFGLPYVVESWPIYRGSLTSDFAGYVERTFDLQDQS